MITNDMITIFFSKCLQILNSIVFQTQRVSVACGAGQPDLKSGCAYG